MEHSGLTADHVVVLASSPESPPGLPRLPIIGSILFLRGDLRQRLTELKDSYGEVSSVYLGEALVVVLNGVDIIRDTFGKRGQLFSDRPSSYYRDDIGQGRVVFSNGEIWKTMRRFSLQALKDFGMGKPIIQDRILEEIDAFIKKLSNYDDRPINLDTYLSTAVENIACSVILGKRFAYDDPKFLTYINHLRGLFHAAHQGNKLIAFPWLRYIPGDPFEFNKGRTHNLALLSIHRDIVSEHKETRSGIEQRDILDVFDDRLSQTEKGDPVFTEVDLLQTSEELVRAGTETTAIILRWGILFLAQHPEIQKELQDEVDTVLGDEVPNYSMRQELPKVECLRFGDIVPFITPHAPSEDSTINGFTIPKGTMIIANIHGVHHDPRIWGNPNTFRPWRFLTDDEKINTDLSTKVFSFSLGKKSCIGESLARMELFLFSCRLLRRFTFSSPDGGDLDNVGGTLGITYTPNPHEIKIQVRRF